jgi:hypothetical protein
MGLYTFTKGLRYSMGATLSSWEPYLLEGKLYAEGFREIEIERKDETPAEFQVGRAAEVYTHVIVADATKSGPIQLDDRIGWVNELIDDEDDVEPADEPEPASGAYPSLPGWMPQPSGGWMPKPDGAIHMTPGNLYVLLVVPMLSGPDLADLNASTGETFRFVEAVTPANKACVESLGGQAGASSILEVVPSQEYKLTYGASIGRRGHKLAAGCETGSKTGLSTTSKVVIGGLIAAGLLFALSGD